ncbi:cytochrome P450 [Xylariaceae sp. FL1272]|nr:cytochrome P450 [Xylariaceae sp. FL1272]
MAFTGIMVATGATILIALIVAHLKGVGRRPKDLPPGPPTLPIIGNLHQMPKSRLEVQFKKWAEEYGPVYSLILGSQVQVVLSDGVAIKELLDKKSAIYSDRLPWHIVQGVCSGGHRFLMMPYGDTWRTFRKIGHQSMNSWASKKYIPYQMEENDQMMHEILHSPKTFFESFRRYSNSLSTHMIYGWRTRKHDDPRLLQVYDQFFRFGTLAQTPEAFLIDAFPVLRHLPDFLSPVKRASRAQHKRELKMYGGLYSDAKKSLAEGTLKPCVAMDMIEEQKKGDFSDDQAAYAVASWLEAGSDTTSSTLYGFVCAMLLFPEVQAKAQKELDEVIGSRRMPDLDDEFSLPYIRACVKESFRWMPVASLGAAPHATTRDDFYMGYRIPKGAGIVQNIYTMHMDPKRYENPRQFNPDRFYGDTQSAAEASLNPDPSLRDHYGFGAGRRICLGMFIAERSLFLGISRLLWAFNFACPKDAQGNDILPDGETLIEGLAVHPYPFDADITVRSPGKARIIDEQFGKQDPL